MEVVVRQISGLGNQLFQYAAGRYYAAQHNASMRVAIDPPEKAFSYGAPRPFLLSHFAIRAPYAPLTRAELQLIHSGKRHRALTALPRFAIRMQVVEETPDQRHTFVEALPLQAHTRKVYLVGYWQTYKTVEAQAATLRDEFTLQTELSPQSASLLDRVSHEPQSVSLHIRRGDYTLAAEGNRVLPMKYYMEAMERMRGLFPKAVFFVFSDDMEFARRELHGLQDVAFVDHNTAVAAHEDLWLMSRCHHHILANSSFSWWGAWLNPRSAKHVIAPKQWMMTPGSYYPELMPPAWELLDVAT